MNTKKLAFIIPSLKAGGAERVVSTLATQLVDNFDVMIIVLYHCTPFYAIDPKVQIKYLKDDYNSTPSIFQSIMNHFDLIRSARKEIKSYQTDIIIVFTTIPNIYSIILAKQLKLKSIISERIHPRFGSISKFWVTLRKWIYPKTDMLVIQTKDIANYFNDFMRTEKLQIINNPLSDELANQKKDIEYSVRKKHVICVGRLEDQKNQELLINAFSNIDHSGWKLLLIGQGRNHERYQVLIDKLGMQESIELVGNAKNIFEYYNTARIFVLSSNYEGFPNALIEAMYFGMACIATDCPSGPSEIILDMDNGILIPVDDQFQLERNLNTLMQDEVIQTQLGQNAEQSTAIFNARSIANTWQELIYNTLK